MNFVSTCPGAKELGKPTLNLLGGSVRIFGNMNRTVPSVHSPRVAAIEVKPTPSAEPSSMFSTVRRSSSTTGLGGAAVAAAVAGLGDSFFAAAAGFVAGAGFAAAGLGAGADSPPSLPLAPARAAASISATLGRAPEAAGFGLAADFSAPDAWLR